MNYDIGAELLKLEQAEKRERLQINREKSARQKRDKSRRFIVGEIFLEIFPEFLSLQPQLTKQDNDREFRVLRDFLSAVAAEGISPASYLGHRSALMNHTHVGQR